MNLREIEVFGSPAPCYMNLREIEISGSLSESLNNVALGKSVHSSEYSYGDPSRLIDDVISTSHALDYAWHASTTPSWVVIDLGLEHSEVQIMVYGTSVICEGNQNAEVYIRASDFDGDDADLNAADQCGSTG